jgi:hypothetical protein
MILQAWALFAVGLLLVAVLCAIFVAYDNWKERNIAPYVLKFRRWFWKFRYGTTDLVRIASLRNSLAVFPDGTIRDKKGRPVEVREFYDLHAYLIIWKNGDGPKEYR